MATMSGTVSIPRHEYEELLKYKSIIHGTEKAFNFSKAFGIGKGKIKAQQAKDALRKEW